MMQEICEKANLLRLKIIGEQLPQIMDMAGKKNWPCLKTMAHLFDLEIETRRQNRIAVCFRQSKLNEKLTIDQFDFNHHSSRKKQKTRILNLMACILAQNFFVCAGYNILPSFRTITRSAISAISRL